MAPPKYYYFIEDLDVSGDNIPDGVLIRQFKIFKTSKQIIYTKNNYISNIKLNSLFIKKKKNIDNKLFNDTEMNLIKNSNYDFNNLPRIIIMNNTSFSKCFINIDLNMFLKELNKLFSN